MMGNYEQLKAAVASIVRDNGAEEITGNVLQSVLISIINSVGSGAVFAGIATPSTSPSNPDPNMFYIAVEAGTYPNFNLTVTTGMCIFMNESGTWVGHELNISSQFESGEYITDVSITGTLEGAETDNLPTVGAVNEAVAALNTALNTAIATELHDRQEADGEQLIALNLEKTLRQQGDEANEASVGYYVCDTAAATSAKVVNASGYVLRIGGNMRIKMTNANTADNVTLNINGTGEKALFYNVAQASSDNTWEIGEVLEIYYDGVQFQAQSAKGAVKKLVVFGGGDYFHNKGGYDATGTLNTSDNTSYGLIPVADYIGKTAMFNFISGWSSFYSGFLDDNGNVLSTFQYKTSAVVPPNAVTLFLTATNLDGATNTVTFEVDGSEDLTAMLSDSYIEDTLGVRFIATEPKYYMSDGYTLGNGGYHLCVDVTNYRGMKVVLKPCWGGTSFTGFKLSDGTYKSIPVSRTIDFAVTVPLNAVELRSSYQSSQTDRYVTFQVPKTLNDVYDDLLSKEQAAAQYINKSLLIIGYDLDDDDIIADKYCDANGTIRSANGFYAYKIDDLTSYDGQNWVGGTYKIGGSGLFTGGAGRCGIINTDNSVTLITTTEQFEGTITSTMRSLFVTWRTTITDAVVELRKEDTNIVRPSDLSAALQEAKDYTDDRLIDAGLVKLPNVKWYVLGDSISDYRAYVDTHYFNFIAARNNMTFDNATQCLAVAGRTVSASQANSICHDVSLLVNPRIITIMAGVNDFGHDIALGTLVDNSGYVVDAPTSIDDCIDFASSLLYVLDYLKSHYPSAVIAWILPMRNNNKVTNELGLRIEKYWEYIYTACSAYSVSVIPLGKDCSLMDNPTYFIDGLHPNEMGQKIISYYVENHLSLVVPTEWE